MRLIYYSVAFTASGKYERQWYQSIRSLRSHNGEIPVYLFAFDMVTPELLHEASRRNVVVFPLGDYRQWLGKKHHQGAVLAQYPTLHQLLVSADLQIEGLSQILYVDCDTYFFSDPEALFDIYCSNDWYAREVPGSRLCPNGPTENVDEQQISRIAAQEGLNPVPAYNTGVCLLNRGLWTKFAKLSDYYFDCAWRLMVGMQHKDYDPGPLARQLRQNVLNAANAEDHERALPYPSNNWWILDEIACLLTLGKIEGLTQAVLGRDLVTQGLEFVSALNHGKLPILSHYFSCNQDDFFAHVPPIQPY
jgi:hypothetical protein